MKANSGGMVGSIPTPEVFRALATGMGNDKAEIQRTGMHRSQCVIDCAPPGQAKAAKGAGYPAKSASMTDECY